MKKDDAVEPGFYVFAPGHKLKGECKVTGTMPNGDPLVSFNAQFVSDGTWIFDQRACTRASWDASGMLRKGAK